jgi:hypothetical protein
MWRGFIVAFCGLIWASAAAHQSVAQTGYTDGNGNTYLTSRNANGVILKSTKAILFLGKSCDAISPQYGKGKWAWANGGFLVTFENTSVGFPRQELNIENNNGCLMDNSAEPSEEAPPPKYTQDRRPETATLKAKETPPLTVELEKYPLMTHINITAREDGVQINDISVNRGKCFVGNNDIATWDKPLKYPIKLNFSEEASAAVAISSCTRIIEISISTNQGTWVSRF